MSNSQVVVISGQSGVGKDTVINQLRSRNHGRYFVVTATTRPPRAGEENGISYHFFSLAVFQKMLKEGEFIESAKVYDNWYGVPKSEIRKGLQQGKDVIIKLDVQGALTIKKIIPQAVLIFISSPSIEELSRRLNERGTETEAALQLRLKTAQDEINNLAVFDHVVINYQGQLDHTVSEIDTIIESEKGKGKKEIVL